MNKKATNKQLKMKSKVKKARSVSLADDNGWEITEIIKTPELQDGYIGKLTHILPNNVKEEVESVLTEKTSTSRKNPVDEWEVTNIKESLHSNVLPVVMESTSEAQDDSDLLLNKEIKEETESVLTEDSSSIPQKKRKKGSIVQRSEASLNISEFNLNEVGKEKVSLSDLVKSSQKLAGQTEIKKQLERVKKLKTIPVPLSKPQVQKIKRAAAYNKVCGEVSKWDSVVESNRTADQIIYPLKKPQVSIETFDRQAETFVTKHPVEIAVNELLNKSEHVLDNKKAFTEAEQKILDAMSPLEAKRRMQELMKQRALMSYQQIKACRQNKIKSKKYRRLLKKERLKKLMKEFEELEKTDAAAALEKVMEADKLRVLERVTLKHRNTGKWAKVQKLRAKYNPDARNVLKEDLSIGRQLKEKLPEVEKAITRLKTTMEQQDEDDEEMHMEEALLDEEANPLETEGGKSAEPDISDQWLVKAESLLNKAAAKKGKNKEKVKVSSSNKQDFVDVESITKSSALDSCKTLNIIDGDDMDGGSEDGNESDAERPNGIDEAFADEELIAEFREERDSQNKKPKGIDLFLPGWGSWTGPNIKDSKRKRRRFFVKAVEDKAPKKNTLGTVILNEERDKKVSSLQVSNLPYPFTNVTQFESHMRQPLGHNWNPQSSFQNLNAPKVIVKAGKIIDPIDAEDVLLGETKKDEEKEAPAVKRARTEQLPLEAF